ncbi:RxLR effector protein [Phytophthora megakarya]|uniref:RxLR effector protein n=1 Tax=Phytophthora megakarya TaxID=4795 RepID=A0A225UST7_9STRA|nr:RxLR effector protein [Phytophthora megakarya]
MRFHYVLFLAGATLTSVSASSKAMEPRKYATHLTDNFDSPQIIDYTRKLLRFEDGDEERAIPVVGKLGEIIEKGALTVAQNARVRTWLMKATSTDDAFKALELNMAGSKIFESPKFATWVLYVTKIEKQNPEEIILSKLMTQYNPYTLAKMITSAEKVPKMKELATSLQAQQRQVWLSADESADAVFKLLRLDEAGTDLFKSPQFSTWISYVDAFNTKNPKETASIFATVTRTYDDAALSKMLEAASKVPKTEIIATNLKSQLQTKRIQAWVTSGTSVDDVFKVLKLDRTGTNLFKNSQITTWTSYVDAFNKNFPDEAISVVSKLSKSYDDATLSGMLEAAKAVPGTKKIASYLQGQQNQIWLAEGKTADDIFKLLKLHEPSLENLIDPRLSAWNSFTRAYNMAVDPGKEASLVGTMTTYYTELGLAQLLEAGKKIPQTEKVAKDLQVAQFTRWLNEGKKKDDLITVLKLGDDWSNDADAVIYTLYGRFYDAHNQVIARANRK